ncbi:MAG: NeuD/PglB/VioB family sugar acetyltransferase [Anaerosomatales bacterium]|nr:NeuD/PglB/VioB family sugar acetyltransferase [Anaerosomatales bacterium]
MRFLIIGAGGYAAEVADMLADLGHTAAAYFDEHDGAETGYRELPIVRSLDDADADAAVIAIGDGAVRERLFDAVAERFALPSLVHPTAWVSPSAALGDGALVMQQATVTARASVGRCAIVNVGCYVAHDCRVGDFTHLAGGVQLGGFASVGDRVLCGTGSVVLPSVSVGDDATLGAGAVVIAGVPDGATVVGVPAAPIDGTDRETAVDE